MRAYVKRIVFYIIAVFVSFLLQCTLFDTLALGSVKPNLFIILTSSIGFMRGRKEGLFVGFFCGLLTDIFFGTMLGFYAFVYMIIGYINGSFRRLFYDDDIKLPLLLIGASELAFGLIMYVGQYLLRSRFRFLFYLRNIIVPELIYTILVTLIFYRLIVKINQKLEEQEQRSASKFV